jgi:hypothetical protein
VFPFLLLLFALVFIIGIAHVALAGAGRQSRFVVEPIIPWAAVLAILLGNRLVSLIGLDVIRF